MPEDRLAKIEFSQADIIKKLDGFTKSIDRFTEQALTEEAKWLNRKEALLKELDLRYITIYQLNSLRLNSITKLIWLVVGTVISGVVAWLIRAKN